MFNRHVELLNVSAIYFLDSVKKGEEHRTKVWYDMACIFDVVKFY